MVTQEEFLDYYMGWAGPARRALAAGAALRLPAGAARSGRVVLCGMGGSGVAGDYVETLAGVYGGAVAVSVKAPRPPAWVNAGDLVVAASFSGNTRETLECARRSLLSGAYIVAVTSGGRLASLARRWGMPVLIVEEAPAPRAGWPQLFYSIASMLAANGLLQLPLWDLEASIEMLGDREAVASEAEALASWLVNAGNLVVLAPEPLYPAAVRMRSELAENAKITASASQLPEAGHNELEAWAASGSLDAVILDPVSEPWSSLLAEAARTAGFRKQHVVNVRGESLLQKLVWATWLAGVSSVKAAILRGIDPYMLAAVKQFRSIVEKATNWGEGEEAPRL